MSNGNIHSVFLISNYFISNYLLRLLPNSQDEGSLWWRAISSSQTFPNGHATSLSSWVIEQLFHLYFRPGNFQKIGKGLTLTGSNSRLRPNFTTPTKSSSPILGIPPVVENCIGGRGHSWRPCTPVLGGSAQSCIRGPATLSEALHNLTPCLQLIRKSSPHHTQKSSIVSLNFIYRYAGFMSFSLSPAMSQQLNYAYFTSCAKRSSFMSKSTILINCDWLIMGHLKKSLVQSVCKIWRLEFPTSAQQTGGPRGNCKEKSFSSRRK